MRRPELSRLSRPSRPPLRRLGAALLTVSAAAAAFAVSTAPADASPAPTRGRPAGVLANLWEWNWPSVANECTSVLGPAGYAGVQVAPPQDSLKRNYTSPDAPIVHPWWEVYQPVDYNLTSRMGTEDQFKAMVTTCRRAGVKVYVDAVINHMTGQGTRSYGGQTYTHFDYPGVYGYDNFHHTPTDCPTASGGIEDFNNYTQVTQCELLGLADLDTEDLATRGIIASYLNKLISYGVSGFRVDAAKHIGEPDLIALQKLLNNTVDGTRPYFALEVFPGGPGQLSQQAFTTAGDVLGFDYAYQIKNAFKSYAGENGNITGLRVFGEASGLVASDKSLAFIENHDTERGSDTLSYKDGATNIIANEFMLAYPYGTPQVYSAFAFTNSYDSPPSAASGMINNTDCSGRSWVCVDRDPGVVAMVKFANEVGKSPVKDWWDDNTNMIAFSRGTTGFFSVNNAFTPMTASIPTTLPAGTYCDTVTGGLANGACAGTTVVVDYHGVATVTVAGKSTLAITASSRLS